MPKTAVPRKPESLARKADETRLTSRNRSLASLLGIGDSERQLARDFGSGLNDVLGRGTLAGLIGLPGDLGGMAENGIRGLIGLPQVEPFGGSEHIGRKLEEYGLVSPERRPVTEAVASMISPAQLASASYRAPQMARAGTTALERLMTRSTMGGVNRPAAQVGAIDIGRMVAPQDEALRIAQQNAAKPVSEGGLGLRPDNTPEERAAAMGFDIDNPMAHGTNKPNITEFKVGKGGVDEIGAGVYAAPIDSRPFGYTYSNAWAQGKKAVNYPIVVKNDLADYDSIRRGLSTPIYKMPDGTPISPMSDDEASLIQRIVDKEPGWADDIPLLREHIRQMDASSVIKKAGYAGAKSVDSQVPGQVLTFDPKNIRSRFAAFDPFRRNEADIMAGFAPVGIGAYLYGQDEP